MSYENLKLEQWWSRSLKGQAMPRLLAAGLCATALLLLGCRSSQVAGEEAIASDGTVGDRPAAAEAASETDRPGVQALAGLAQTLPVTAQVELGSEVIELEVTRNQQEQATGLMHRASLADDRGMLFRFDPARPVQFWMKNVVIDLDMVFVHQGKIVGIAADVPPCTTTPCPTYGPGFGIVVDEVIELRGGRAAELGLTIGDAALVKAREANEPPL